MTPHENLRQQYTTIQALQKSLSVLQWDRQTMMPARGASARTTHVGQLTRLAHELLTGEEFQRALEAAEAAEATAGLALGASKPSEKRTPACLATTCLTA